MARLNRVPQAPEAEESYLGAVILRGTHALKAGGTMEAAWFFDPRHRLIFGAIKSLADRGISIDPVLVWDELRGRGYALGMGLAYLSELVHGVPTADNVAFYASRIRETWMMREILKRFGQLVVSDVDDPTEWLMMAEKALREESETWRRIRSSEEKPSSPGPYSDGL